MHIGSYHSCLQDTQTLLIPHRSPRLGPLRVHIQHSGTYALLHPCGALRIISKCELGHGSAYEDPPLVKQISSQTVEAYDSTNGGRKSGILATNACYAYQPKAN